MTKKTKNEPVKVKNSSLLEKLIESNGKVVANNVSERANLVKMLHEKGVPFRMGDYAVNKDGKFVRYDTVISVNAEALKTLSEAEPESEVKDEDSAAEE